jgi:two-component system response regulator PilR (NtrC family)
VLQARTVRILLCDGQSERRRSLEALIRGAVPDASVAAGDFPGPLDQGWDLALVGLEGGEGTRDRALEAVKSLRGRAVPLIAYGDGSSQWPLPRRCQVLLAGAPILLDARGVDFQGLLATEVATRAGIAAGARTADRRLAAVAGELGIVGESPAWKAALAAIERSSRLCDMPVLLLGESGTGKDLLARAVHRLDPRRQQQPFVPVNCAALTRTLAEAELFGHRKGVYSGADRERPGLIRAASGGVLFLDEIGELDLEVQAKLLRVIQERRVLTLGDTQETAVDVRIVAATHRDLRAMVREERFRADLLNRLWVYPVEVPALRQRREDIPGLVDFLVRKHAGPEGIPAVSGEFLEGLRLARLEGNVRQLEGIVQRAVAVAGEGRPLGLGELPPELWAELAAPACPAMPAAPARLELGANLNLERALDRHERLVIETALAASGWNQARAASVLGIAVRSMYTKLRKHGLLRAAGASR